MERPRPSPLPAEIVNDLMAAARSFYSDFPERWFADQSFIRQRVVTWPAGWLRKRGVSLKPERYKEILLGLFLDIKRKGNTGAVKYWPGYLAHCVQEHFKHHGDEIYEEAKSFRVALENALGKAQTAPRPDPVAVIAQVHQALAKKLNRKHRRSEKQLSL